MVWLQRTLRLAPRRRGLHLITSEVSVAMPELSGVAVGMLQLFLQHTSASLSINENADPDVPLDLDDALESLAPENRGYRHVCEGPDDMPAHVKATLVGCALTIPVGDGNLQLGTWQGIYLCEHRNSGGPRRIIATLWGQPTTA